MQKTIAFWAAGLGFGVLGIWHWGLLAAEGPIFDSKGNIIQRVPQPKLQELSRAEKAVEEVFGRDIAKAKTAADRVKIAQEILKSAREEQDMAVRFAALQGARRLAVEALDGKLGLEIVREIVNTYQPLEEMSKEDRLAEADRLWGQAERSQGREKLAKQLEAVEQWLYCEIASGLTAKKWEGRMGEIGQIAPQIVLEAKNARTSSPTVGYQAGWDAINVWNDASVYISWKAFLYSGSYDISIEYAADPPMAWQSVFGIGIFEPEKTQPVAIARTQLRPTGPWATFTVVPFGYCAVQKDGEYEIRLFVIKKIPPEPKLQGIIAPRKIIFVHR